MKTKRKLYFMDRPKRHLPNGQPVLNRLFYVRFQSLHPFPWYQASVLVKDYAEAMTQFREFVLDCIEDQKSIADES